MKMFVDFDGCFVENIDLGDDYLANQKTLMKEPSYNGDFIKQFLSTYFNSIDLMVINTSRNWIHLNYIHESLSKIGFNPDYIECSVFRLNTDYEDIHKLAMYKVQTIVKHLTIDKDFIMIDDNLPILKEMKIILGELNSQGKLIHYTRNKFNQV